MWFLYISHVFIEKSTPKYLQCLSVEECGDFLNFFYSLLYLLCFITSNRSSLLSEVKQYITLHV